MTLIINITTPEGIVMASDSRQTQRNTKQMTRVSTNNASKLFAVNNRVVVGTAGLAFFADNTGIQKNVSKYVESFCKSMDLEKLTVKEIANSLHAYINSKYPWEEQLDASAKQLKIDAERGGGEVLAIEKSDDSIEFKIKQATGRIEEGHLNIEAVDLIISGFNTDGSFETYELRSPGKIQIKRRDHEYGSTWVGQGDVVSRLILGYDAKIQNIPMFQRIVQNQDEEFINQLHGLEYNIQWGLMNLQDAIDLSVFLIKTTSTIQKYADGINMDIGDIQGVGGPIDVVIITKDNGIEWIKQKKYKYPEF